MDNAFIQQPFYILTRPISLARMLVLHCLVYALTMNFDYGPDNPSLFSFAPPDCYVVSFLDDPNEMKSI